MIAESHRGFGHRLSHHVDREELRVRIATDCAHATQNDKCVCCPRFGAPVQVRAQAGGRSAHTESASKELKLTS